MSDYFLIENDQVIFLPNFGEAIVAVRPGMLGGSGKTKIMGKKVCIEGDEKNVLVSGCSYFTPSYPIVGTGNLEIEKLDASQKAKDFKDSDKAMLLKGNYFDAKFTVISPAMQTPPATGMDQPNKIYKGKGYFITTNVIWTGK